MADRTLWPPEMEEVKRAVFPYAPNPVEVRAMSPTKNHAVAAIGAPQVTTLSVRCRKADAFRGRHVGGSVERREYEAVTGSFNGSGCSC